MNRWQSGPWGFLGVAALLVLALLVLGVLEERGDRSARGDREDRPTATGTPADAGTPAVDPPDVLPTELGWKYVDLGSMRGTSLAPGYSQPEETAPASGYDAYVAGSDRGRAALMLHVDGGDTQPVDMGEERLPEGTEAHVVAHGVVTAVTVTGTDGPEDDWLLGDSGLWFPLTGPRDTDGAPLHEVVAVPNDEDGYLGAVGVLGDRSRPTLGAWWAESEWARLDAGLLRLPRPLVSDDTGRGLIAATTETTIIAATQDDQGVSVHRIDAYGDQSGDISGRWQPVRIPRAMERVTGVAHWELAVWLVGHGAGGPQIVECGGGPRCTRLAPPDVRLDPSYAKVEMIAEPIVHPMVLAVQTADGPQIWVDAPGGWVHFPAPDGHVGDGMVIGDRLFLLVDGNLFTGRLPARLGFGDD